MSADNGSKLLDVSMHDAKGDRCEKVAGEKEAYERPSSEGDLEVSWDVDDIWAKSDRG